LVEQQLAVDLKDGLDGLQQEGAVDVGEHVAVEQHAVVKRIEAGAAAARRVGGFRH
jgi:hypothetical protein